MSDQRPQEWGQPSPNPPDQTLLPPSSTEGMGPQPAWMPPAPPAPHSIWNSIAAYTALIAVDAAAAGAGIGWSLARAVNNLPVAQSTAQPEAPIQQVTPGTGSSSSSTVAAIAAKVSPAIVDINTALGNGSAAGSGMLISSRREVLANDHVGKGSPSITVAGQGRWKEYTAKMVSVSPTQDVAVIAMAGSVSRLPT